MRVKTIHDTRQRSFKRPAKDEEVAPPGKRVKGPEEMADEIRRLRHELTELSERFDAVVSAQQLG